MGPHASPCSASRNKEKNEENNEVSPLNRATFSFTSIFSDWPPLNRKSRFSRSEILKKSETAKYFFGKGHCVTFLQYEYIAYVSISSTLHTLHLYLTWPNYPIRSNYYYIQYMYTPVYACVYIILIGPY